MALYTLAEFCALDQAALPQDKPPLLRGSNPTREQCAKVTALAERGAHWREYITVECVQGRVREFAAWAKGQPAPEWTCSCRTTPEVRR